MGQQNRQKTCSGSDALYRCVLALSFESYLPLTKKFQSRQSSWLYFSSCFSEIIKTLAAGRVGHMAGVCSAWCGTVSCQAWSPSLSPPPSPIPGFLPGAAVTAPAAGAIAWVTMWFFIFTLLPPQLSYFFLRTQFWEITLPVSRIYSTCSSEKDLLFSLTSSDNHQSLSQSWEHQVAAGCIIALALMGFSLFLQKCHRHPITLLWTPSPENSPVPHSHGSCIAIWPCLCQPQCDQNSYGVSTKLSETDCEENPSLEGKKKIR